ncbi:MAG: kelch repeat-containing protein [Bacteroidota bacterium]
MKLSSKLLIALSLVLFMNTKMWASYTPNSWDSMTSIPPFISGLQLSASFTIGNTIYICGGMNSSSNPTNGLYGYNTVTKTWSTLASFTSTARFSAVGFALNGEGYVGMGFGPYDIIAQGYTVYNDFKKYDPVTNTWSAVSALPLPSAIQGYTGDAIAFTISGKAYVGLGGNYDNQGVLPVGTTYLWSYDPNTNAWTQKQDFIGSARTQAVSFVINNKAYVGTGFNGNVGGLSDFFLYDPVLNQWAAVADTFPTGGTRLAKSFSICDYGYVGGGCSNNMYQYDPNNTPHWVLMDTLPITTSVTVSTATNVGGDTSYGYVMLGHPNCNTTLNTLVCKYSPPTMCVPAAPTVINNITQSDIAVYPNPVRDVLNISNSGQAVSYELSDMYGRIVVVSEMAANEHAISVENLAAGIYLLKINTSKGEAVVKLIEKR